MKFIYFDRLLFLNDDFELGFPILCLNIYYRRSILIIMGNCYTIVMGINPKPYMYDEDELFN